MKTTSYFISFALAIVAALIISMVAQAAIGDLDPTFGNGGKVITNISGSNSYANAVAVQPDGKIVVTGGSQVVRYNNDGTLDTTFGTNGIVTNSGIGGGMDLVIQPDGKIVVAGFSGGGFFACFHAARLNSNGSPDTSFGTNGIAIPLTFQDNGSNRVAYGHSIALGPNGKILAAGEFVNGDMNISSILVSLNSNGSLDTWNYSTVSTEDYLTAMAIQTDGKIILAGNSFPGDGLPPYYYNGPSLYFLRFYYATIDGSTYLEPDTSFGGGGTVIPSFGSNGFIDYSAALQSDGKIVAVGEYGSTAYKFSLARFNSNGSLDTTFGTNGLTITNLSDMSTVPYYNDNQSEKLLAIQPDGKIVVAGDTSNGHFFLARFNSNGSPDTTFGNAGQVATAFGTSDDVRAIILQRDGKIIAAGSTSNGANTGIALARYVVANVTSVTTTFISEAANDGTILESAQNSGVGGTQNGFATTISVGDDPGNRQYRSILSFHTESIPDNAVITAAQLKIRLQGIVGTDPFATGFGNLLVDIHSGYFGNSIGLELVDFSAPASPSTYQEHLTAMPPNWYGTNLSAASNLELISKIGWTQFRLRFALATNNNKIADYDKFYSGDAPTGYQPQLIVTYYVP